MLHSFVARLNSLQKKCIQQEKPFPQGLKPTFIMRVLTYGLKPIPFKTEAELEFSASCEVVPFQNGIHYTFLDKPLEGFDLLELVIAPLDGGGKDRRGRGRPQR